MLGDVRVILCRNGQAVILGAEDDDTAEGSSVDAITQRTGPSPRVSGGHRLSRAFGFAPFKTDEVPATAKPPPRIEEEAAEILKGLASQERCQLPNVLSPR